MKFLPNLSRSEQKYGILTFVFCLLLLPGALMLALPGFSSARLNFTTYFITAGALVWVLRRFLLCNLRSALERPFQCLYYAAIGYLGQMGLTEVVSLLVYRLAPDFVNLNNQTVTAMLDSEFALMAFTTIVLAPIAEECFFRGLLFLGLYDRSPVLAWVVSVGLFAAMHIVGYTGLYTPLEMLLAFIQYLPAGVALCISYQRGGTIFCPILTHAIVNAMALWQVLG